MRNNIFWETYIQRVELAGISIDNELQDVLEEIAPRRRHEWYEDLAKKIEILRDHIRTGDPITTRRRKKLTPAEYLETFVCDPAVHITSITHKWPKIDEPTEDGRIRYEFEPLSAEEDREVELLHWIYIELRAVEKRLMINAGEEVRHAD